MHFPSDSGSEDSCPSELSTEDRSQIIEDLIQDQNIRLGEERETDSPVLRSDIFDLVALEYLTLEDEERSLEEGKKFLDRTNLVNKLETVVTNRLSVVNCLFLFRAVSSCELSYVRDACYDVICRNFPKVVETSRSFLDLSLEEMRQLVLSDLLHATEERVFNAIVRWIQADPLWRRCHLSELMRAIRIHRCSLSNSTWLCSVGHKILVLEGENRKFRSFDVETRIWVQLRPPPHYKQESSAAYYDHHMYLLGGESPHGNRCFRYDARADLWKEIAPMIERRVWAASACHAGKLYCSGGESRPSRRILSSMEVLELQGDEQWYDLPSLGVQRANHCLVSCGRFLWAIGGDNRVENLRSVERFDVERSCWSHVRPLDTPRCDMSVTVLHGRIYVIAGWTTGDASVPTVEVYDAEEDQWDYAASLLDGRDSHGSCVVRSLLDEDAL